MAEDTLGKMLERGIAAQRAGQFDKAEQEYNNVLAEAPGYFEAGFMLGLLQLQRNNWDEAEKLLAQAIAKQPENAGAHSNRGIALFHLARLDEARQACERAIALNPKLVMAHLNRAKALLAMRHYSQALAGFDTTLHLNPHLTDAWHARGNALMFLGRPAEALASFDRALALNPRSSEALLSRGFTLETMKRFDEAFIAYDRAFAVKPEEQFLEASRLHAKMHVCDWRNFAGESALLLAHVDEGKPVASPFPLLSIASTPRQQFLAAEKFAELRRWPHVKPLWNGEVYGHAKIRVAYLSASLIYHPVGILAAGLFERHDRTQIETVALSFAASDNTPTRKRLEAAFDRFIDATQMSDYDVARLLRSMEIDIAVDLDGVTNGGRMEIMAHRPAPVQVSYLGFPGTLGASYVDYILADTFVIPPEIEADFAEKIARLPNSYLPNTERNPLQAPPTRAECGLPENAFVYCCFNNSFKFTPDVFDIWMRLLQSVDGSVLWLREVNAFVRSNLLKEAASRGIAPERIIFAPQVEKMDDHFARQQHIDVFLDTFYYNAHTTASDALWAGVPVVTCLGATFSARVGASLLQAVGLPELITSTPEEYEKLALKLAREPQLLAAIKQKLAHNRTKAPLFDIARLTQHVESAYRMMWQRAERKEAPDTFTVQG